MMILVSGSTRTVRGLADLWPIRLGHLLTPKSWNSLDTIERTGLFWAADNGAFSGFDPSAFRHFAGRLVGRQRLLWVSCPDVVADARATLDRFAEWQPELHGLGLPLAFVGQDGQENLPVPWERFRCLFIGGSTRWKLSRHAADLIDEARRRGKWVHMGRVNTFRRLRLAHDLGCDSVDGSCYSMYGDTYLQRSLRWVEHLEQSRTLF